MTFHFSYPNVLPRQGIYIGCGRYALFPFGSSSPGDEYIEAQGIPNTPNKNTLNRIAQLLAPGSYSSNMVLFHKQDQQNRKYQGDSLDLAWLLTHVLRACDLSISIKTDIWCTGILQIYDSGPHLLDVEQNGFYLKLQAFLDMGNQDRIFIVPLPNIDPQALQMCEEKNVTIFRIGDLSHRTLKELGTKQKKVIAVATNELQLLLDIFFIHQPIDNKRAKKKHSLIFYLLISLIIMVAGSSVIFFSSIFSPIPVLQPTILSRTMEPTNSPLPATSSQSNLSSDQTLTPVPTSATATDHQERFQMPAVLRLRQSVTKPDIRIGQLDIPLPHTFTPSTAQVHLETKNIAKEAAPDQEASYTE